MKNLIVIDYDSERAEPIIIAKPNSKEPTTPEESKAVIMDDINCVVQTLVRLINIADSSKLAKKDDVINATIFCMNQFKDVEPKPQENDEDK
jgi:hypothetical protein